MWSGLAGNSYDRRTQDHVGRGPRCRASQLLGHLLRQYARHRGRLSPLRPDVASMRSRCGARIGVWTSCRSSVPGAALGGSMFERTIREGPAESRFSSRVADIGDCSPEPVQHCAFDPKMVRFRNALKQPALVPERASKTDRSRQKGRSFPSNAFDKDGPLQE